MRRTLLTLLALLGLLLGAGLTGLSSSAASATTSHRTSRISSVPGVNDWSCKPTRRHPEPAIVVHGTFGDSQHLLERLESTLKARGYCVFALDYGNRATQRIQRSARQLKAYTQKVLTATGARKVEMVGHSQGGMMPRYYIKFLGGARKVDDLVGLAPSNHGTKVATALAPFPNLFCASCVQQRYNSPFLRHLNAGDETPGRVSYTQVETRYDEVVVPYTSAWLKGPASQSSNLLLQKYCPADGSEHLTIPMDGTAIRMVLNAFAHPGPASPARAYSCLP